MLSTRKSKRFQEFNRLRVICVSKKTASAGQKLRGMDLRTQDPWRFSLNTESSLEIHKAKLSVSFLNDLLLLRGLVPS